MVDEKKGDRTNLDKFIKKFFSRKYQTVWNACLGPNQSGKTDLMLFIMERAHALGLFDGFGSNMPLDTSDLDDPFTIDFIEDFETLKQRCQMLNPEPDKHGVKRYLFFGSEMGDWAPKDQPWLNIKFIKELQLVRKYGLSFLGDAIERVDGRILSPSYFHGKFVKVSKTKPQIAYYFDWLRGGKRVTLKNIPRTHIIFNTFYSASFYMEPQVSEGVIQHLNPAHQTVKAWRDNGYSWKKAGIHTQEGKRAIIQVIEYHFDHCLAHQPEPDEPAQAQSITEHEIISES